MTTPTCETCSAPIALVTAEVDAQAIELRFVAQCGHPIDKATAGTLWSAHGYRWPVPLVNGASLIGAERLRQFTDEGYTPDHDTAHGHDSGLAWAAWAYVDSAVNEAGPDAPPPVMWPWGDDAWNAAAPPLRRLVIAGALIAAEIDRRLHEARATTTEEST